jgi:hypothetical protein
MAVRYYGLNKGQIKKDVVEGSSSGSTAVEIAVDLAAITVSGQGRNEVLQLLAYLIQWIEEGKWPPA